MKSLVEILLENTDETIMKSDIRKETKDIRFTKGWISKDGKIYYVKNRPEKTRTIPLTHQQIIHELFPEEEVHQLHTDLMNDGWTRFETYHSYWYVDCAGASKNIKVRNIREFIENNYQNLPKEMAVDGLAGIHRDFNHDIETMEFLDLT